MGWGFLSPHLAFTQMYQRASTGEHFSLTASCGGNCAPEATDFLLSREHGLEDNVSTTHRQPLHEQGSPDHHSMAKHTTSALSFIAPLFEVDVHYNLCLINKEAKIG